MYFVERPIEKWARRTGALYFRYIDDLFIASNATLELLRGLVRFWNRLDENIGFSVTIGVAAQYLDVHLVDEGGRVTTRVYQKPSYEPYFLPYTSAHAAHIKKNIPYGALVRAIRYSTTYTDFKQEETHICMALLLNAYPLRFILEQFQRVVESFGTEVPKQGNYSRVKSQFLEATKRNCEMAKPTSGEKVFFHFSFCKGMKHFPSQFYRLWNECFGGTAISGVKPMVGTRNLPNLQQYLVRKKPNKRLLKVNQQENSPK